MSPTEQVGLALRYLEMGHNFRYLPVKDLRRTNYQLTGLM
jgi:hypothetical protein